MKFLFVACMLALAVTAYSAPVEEDGQLFEEVDYLQNEEHDFVNDEELEEHAEQPLSEDVVEYLPNEEYDFELENEPEELDENDMELLDSLMNHLENEEHDLEAEDDDDFEVVEVGSRQPRVTCDLLSVEISKIGKVNDAACAANCLTLGKAGGRCNKGVCQCRKTTIKDLWDKRFG